MHMLDCSLGQSFRSVVDAVVIRYLHKLLKAEVLKPTEFCYFLLLDQSMALYAVVPAYSRCTKTISCHMGGTVMLNGVKMYITRVPLTFQVIMVGSWYCVGSPS